MKHLISVVLAAFRLTNPMPAMKAVAVTRHHQVHTVSGNLSGISVRYVPGRFVCAKNTGIWLRAHGFISSGSNFARSYFKFQHVARSQARKGDVLVSWRKGRASDGSRGAHNMIVLDAGARRCLNPGTHGWRERVCPAGTIVRTGRA